VWHVIKPPTATVRAQAWQAFRGERSYRLGWDSEHRFHGPGWEAKVRENSTSDGEGEKVGRESGTGKRVIRGREGPGVGSIGGESDREEKAARGENGREDASRPGEWGDGGQAQWPPP
jgi:hypothetical protein